MARSDQDDTLDLKPCEGREWGDREDTLTRVKREFLEAHEKLCQGEVRSMEAKPFKPLRGRPKGRPFWTKVGCWFERVLNV